MQQAGLSGDQLFHDFSPEVLDDLTPYDFEKKKLLQIYEELQSLDLCASAAARK